MYKHFRNNPYPTIEEDLLKALKSSGAIAPEWYDKPQLAHFQRASRTDKGVSAVKMVVSLKIGKLKNLYLILCILKKYHSPFMIKCNS